MQLEVAALRQACRARSLIASGTKAQLVTRLWQHLQTLVDFGPNVDEEYPDEYYPHVVEAETPRAALDRFYDMLPPETKAGAGAPADAAKCTKQEETPPNSWATTASGMSAGLLSDLSALGDETFEWEDVEHLDLDNMSEADELAQQEDGQDLGETSISSSPDLANDSPAPAATRQGPEGTLAVAQQVPEHFAKPRAPQEAKPDSRIAILINGSRGDVQPCVAFACALRARGHSVTVFTNHEFLGFCSAAGVQAVPVYASLRPVFAEIGGFTATAWQESSSVTAEAVQESMVDNANDQDAFRAAKAWVEANPGLVQDPYEALMAFKPSLLLFTLQSQLPAMRYERHHAVPAIAVYFTTVCGAFHSASIPPRPSLFAVSAAVDVPLPSGGRKDLSFVTGPWVLEEEADMSALGGLQGFVDAGEQPVTISWGSMTAKGHSPTAMLGLALRALVQAGKRGVVLGGWAKLHEVAQEALKGQGRSLGPDGAELAAYVAKNVFFAQHAPHSWLLPRSCCVVHHGGAGSTQAAFRARCPQVVTPVFGDQFHFSRRVAELGAGIGLQCSMPNVSPWDLADAITEAQNMVPSVDVAGRLHTEGGVETAADVVECFLEAEVRTGNFAQLSAQHAQACRRGRAGKKPASKQASQP